MRATGQGLNPKQGRHGGRKWGASHDGERQPARQGSAPTLRVWSEFEQIRFVEVPCIGRHELQSNEWFTHSALGKKDARRDGWHCPPQRAEGILVVAFGGASMERFASGEMIQRDVAQRLCAEVRAENRGRWWRHAAWRCWTCTVIGRGEPALLRCAAAPDNRGCRVVNARYEQVGRPLQ